MYEVERCPVFLLGGGRKLALLLFPPLRLDVAELDVALGDLLAVADLAAKLAVLAAQMVMFSPDAFEKIMRVISETDDGRETGGVLLGYERRGGTIVVDDASGLIRSAAAWSSGAGVR
jgi:hypothetical protein